MNIICKAIKVIDAKNKKEIIKKLEKEVDYLRSIKDSLNGKAKSDLDGAISRINEAINELRW